MGCADNKKIPSLITFVFDVQTANGNTFKKWLHAESHCYIIPRYKAEQFKCIHMKMLLTYNTILYITVNHNLKAPDIMGNKH